jgi:hypothetical protein
MKEWIAYYCDALDARVTNWCKRKSAFSYRNPFVPPFAWVVISYVLVSVVVGVIKPSALYDVELLMGGTDLPLLAEFLSFFGYVAICWTLCYGALTVGQRWLNQGHVDGSLKEFGDGRRAWSVTLAIPLQVLILLVALRFWGDSLLNAVSPMREVVWAFWLFAWRQGSGRKRRRKPVPKKAEQSLLERLMGVQPTPM